MHGNIMDKHGLREIPPCISMFFPSYQTSFSVRIFLPHLEIQLALDRWAGEKTMLSRDTTRLEGYNILTIKLLACQGMIQTVPSLWDPMSSTNHLMRISSEKSTGISPKLGDMVFTNTVFTNKHLAFKLLALKRTFGHDLDVSWAATATLCSPVLKCKAGDAQSGIRSLQPKGCGLVSDPLVNVGNWKITILSG